MISYFRSFMDLFLDTFSCTLQAGQKHTKGETSIFEMIPVSISGDAGYACKLHGGGNRAAHTTRADA